MSVAEESRRVVLQWIEYLNEGRLDDIMALGAEGATWWVSGQKEISPLTGTYPYAEREKQFKGILKDAISFTFEVRGVTTEGDTVVVEGAPRAETQDGRIYENDIMMKFVVKDGKIQSVREYVDFFAILKFMGAKTPQGDV
jgi:ketosteroid isomerase-like protein